MNRVTKNSLFLMFSQITGRIIAFVFIIFIARFMGSQEFGKYSFVVAFIMISGILVDFGMDRLLIREIARDKSKYSIYLSNTLLVKIVFSIIMIVLVYLLVNYTNITNGSVKAICVMIFSLSIIFNSIQQTLWAISDAYEEMQYHSLLFFVWNLLRAVIGIAILFGGSGLIMLFKGLLIAEVLSTILSFVIITKKIGIPELTIGSDFILYLIKSAIPFGLIQIFSTLYHRVDTILLSIMKGDVAVGWYSAAHSLALTLLFIPTAITNALFPYISQFFGKSEELFKKTFNEAFKYLLMLGLLIAVSTTILSERIIFLFYGKGYINSIIALQILVWSQTLAFTNCLFGIALLAINKEKQVALILAGGISINIVLNCLLIPQMSYKGAAIAKVAFEIFIFCGCYSVLYKFFSYVFIIKIFGKVVLAGVIMAAFIIKFICIPLIPLILLAAGVYLLVLFVIRALSVEELKAFIQIFKKNL